MKLKDLLLVLNRNTVLDISAGVHADVRTLLSAETGIADTISVVIAANAAKNLVAFFILKILL